VGATRAYVKGPFVVEGMLQGGLGGSLAAGLLWLALRWLARDPATSELLGRTAFALPTEITMALVFGGMAVGIVGSLVSLRRVRV
jgi:cell division transport system permease protein